MTDVFVSHVEEDSQTAIQLAEMLEQAGYATWYYERDCVPGVSYLIQTGQALENCKAVILLVSAMSLPSHQMSREIERAHECGKPFIPLFLGVPYEEFIERQPMWRQAIGTHTGINVPDEGVGVIFPRILKGLEGMGIKPGEGAASAPDKAPQHIGETGKTKIKSRGVFGVIPPIAIAVVVLLIVLLVLWAGLKAAPPSLI